MLISGLPGVGKSTLARALAPHLNAVVFSRDDARQASRPGGLRRLAEILAWKVTRRRLRSTQRRAGAVLAAAVEQKLVTRSAVIVEAVADRELRQRMRELTEQHAARLVQLECSCDRAEHDRRLAERPRFWPGLVERLQASYEVPDECLRLDTDGRPEALAIQVVGCIRSHR